MFLFWIGERSSAFLQEMDSWAKSLLFQVADLQGKISLSLPQLFGDSTSSHFPVSNRLLINALNWMGELFLLNGVPIWGDGLFTSCCYAMHWTQLYVAFELLTSQDVFNVHHGFSKVELTLNWNVIFAKEGDTVISKHTTKKLLQLGCLMFFGSE